MVLKLISLSFKLLVGQNRAFILTGSFIFYKSLD